MALVTPVRPAAWLAAIVASLAGSGAAQAQQMTTNSADFNAA